MTFYDSVFILTVIFGVLMMVLWAIRLGSIKHRTLWGIGGLLAGAYGFLWPGGANIFLIYGAFIMFLVFVLGEPE